MKNNKDRLDIYKQIGMECTFFIINKLREKNIHGNSAIAIINNISASALATVLDKYSDNELSSWNEAISKILESLHDKLHAIKLDVAGISKCDILEVIECSPNKKQVEKESI